VSHDRLANAATAASKLNAAKKSVQGLVAAQQAVLSHLQANARKQLLAEQASQQVAAAKAAASATQWATTTIKAASTSRGTASPTRVGFTTEAPAAPVASSSDVAATVLAAAYSRRGKPYAYGGAGPNAFDCSGLVMWAFAHAGISLPHSAAGQYGFGTHVSRSQLEPGDIVFFNEGGGIGHDGIYVGGGMFIDANHSGGWVDVRSMAYYSGFVGGTRL
jgi:cell wall-associated NlpC family hydrolase